MPKSICLNLLWGNGLPAPSEIHSKLTASSRHGTVDLVLGLDRLSRVRDILRHEGWEVLHVACLRDEEGFLVRARRQVKAEDARKSEGA